MLRLIVPVLLAMTALTLSPTSLAADESAKIDQLIEELGDPRFRVRQKASRELIALGTKARPALHLAVKSTDPEVRRRAELILRAIEDSPAPFLADLKSTEPAVRLRAMQALGQLGPKAKEAVPGLLALVEDKDETVREGAIAALLLIAPDHKQVEKLIPAVATVNGKYAKMLRRIYVPQDVQSYGKFSDYGYYTGNSYVGFNDLPPGHWVYAEPHWYIWGEIKKP